jgi:hypothetical protein
MNRKAYIDDISSVVASKEVIDSLDLFLLLLLSLLQYQLNT